LAPRKAFPLRLPPELYVALRRWADDELRSVNGQIEYLLQGALRKAGRWPPGGKAMGKEDSPPDQET
jgi:hypothetical protein